MHQIYVADPSIPLFYIAALYICNLFNMCNVLFVIEWNFKAIFLIIQLSIQYSFWSMFETHLQDT